MADINEAAVADIARSISASSKYQPLLQRTIMRITTDCVTRHGIKEGERFARALLHQSWGAYYPYRPRFEKLLEKIQGLLTDGRDIKNSILPVLDSHSSTAERVSSLGTFYERIFAVTGIPTTILDLACGLNPLTLPWMSLPEATRYEGRDIDEEQNAFLNSALGLMGFNPEKIRISGGDILCDEPASADVVFMLKLLPVIEHQHKGASLELLRKQPARHIVVSYPSGSLSGGKRKMGDFHADNFMTLVGNERWTISAIPFDREVVFIIGK